MKFNFVALASSLALFVSSSLAEETAPDYDLIPPRRVQSIIHGHHHKPDIEDGEATRVSSPLPKFRGHLLTKPIFRSSSAREITGVLLASSTSPSSNTRARDSPPSRSARSAPSTSTRASSADWQRKFLTSGSLHNASLTKHDADTKTTNVNLSSLLPGPRSKAAGATSPSGMLPRTCRTATRRRWDS